MSGFRVSPYSGRMKSVLVTTDFTPHSQYTLRYVLDLLRHTQSPSRVLLVNTYLVDLNNDPQALLQLNDELKTHSKKNLEKQKREALEWVRNPNIIIDTASHMGSLPNVITNLIRREMIDLVAMGKDGGNHVEQIAELLKVQKCPLLITYDKDQHKFQSVTAEPQESI